MNLNNLKNAVITAIKQNKRRLFIAITIACMGFALILTVLVGVQSQQLTGTQHPGFLVFDNGLVFGLVDQTWSGTKAGLKRFDIIKSFDNTDFSGTKSLFSHINQVPAKSLVSYKIDRDGQDLVLDIGSMPLSQNFVFITFFIFIFCGLTTILTGITVFILRPLARGAFVFFVICSTVGVFEILFADLLAVQRFLLPWQLTMALYPVINLHTIHYLFSLEHITPRFLFSRPIKGTLIGLYPAAILFAFFLNAHTNKSGPGYATALLISNLLFLSGGITTYVASAVLYFKTHSSTTKRRLLLFLVLNVSMVFPFFVYVAQNIFGWLVPIETVLLQIACPLVTVYVLFRHNFLDLRFTPKRRWFYLGFGLFFPILFLMDFVFLGPLLLKWGVPNQLVSPVLASVVACKVGVLVYAAYARIVDRLFFPSAFGFSTLMAQTSNVILRHQTKEEIFAALDNLIKTHWGLAEIHCYFQNTHLSCFERQNISANKDQNTLPQSLSLLAIPLDGVTYIINEFASNKSSPDPALQLLIKNNLNLLLPLKFQDHVYGFMLLGPKPNLAPYTTEDLTCLVAVLATTTVAVINAQRHKTLLDLHKQIKRENKMLRAEIRNQAVGPYIIGQDKGLKSVFETIERINTSDISVLLQGETGTGKEVIAQAIHDRSGRALKPFVKVNCAAIPENLFESTLFGHEKGAFTGATEKKCGFFEAANHGTLFLDEIGEIPLHVQAKILRALQEKEIQRVGNNDWLPVNVRIVAATHRNLEAEVKNKKFREDLYYRLNVLPIPIPPLRERPDDIDDFVAFFMHKYSLEMKKTVKPPDQKDLQKLKELPWPGNVRELQNLVARSMAMSNDDEVIQFWRDPDLTATQTPVENPDPVLETGDFYAQMETFKKAIIKRALGRAEGNKSEAARNLGLHKVSLYKMIKQLGLMAGEEN